MRQADIVILGAGPAGCATALGLAQSGIDSVVLVDKPVRTAFRIGESATPDVPDHLRRLGLPDDMQAMGHRPCHSNGSAWGEGPVFIDDFFRRGTGCAWHLDRAAFDLSLRDAVRRRGMTIYGQGRLHGVMRQRDGWLVAVGGAEASILSCRILVDAGGRRSPLATRMGARRHKIDQLIALAVIIPQHGTLIGQSLVESAPFGWWYAAPLPDGRAILALMTDADLARLHGFRQPGAYRAAFAQTCHLRHMLALPNCLPSIASFAAHSGCVNRAAGPGWAAVGDALMGFDPLTSSGIAGAFSDAQALVPVLACWLRGDDPGPVAVPYLQRANNIMNRYIQQRHQRYGWERRWADMPFWARRHGAAEPEK